MEKTNNFLIIFNLLFILSLFINCSNLHNSQNNMVSIRYYNHYVKEIIDIEKLNINKNQEFSKKINLKNKNELKIFSIIKLYEKPGFISLSITDKLICSKQTLDEKKPLIIDIRSSNFPYFCTHNFYVTKEIISTYSKPSHHRSISEILNMENFVYFPNLHINVKRHLEFHILKFSNFYK